MQSNLRILLLSTLLVFPVSKNLRAADDGDRTLNAMPGTPKIDGEIDDAWANAPVAVTDRHVESESSAGPEGSARAKFRCLWDKEHLYVLAEVTDSKLEATGEDDWQQDSVEIFVDENMSKSDEYQSDDGQYRVNCEGKLSFGSETKEFMVGTAKNTDNGYIVEAAIKLSTIAGAAGGKIGFDLQLNDDNDDSGTRSCIMKWNDSTNETFRDLSNIGTVHLVDAVKSAAKSE